MPKENNKMQVDIDTLKKQNVNDLLSIKELYRKLEELGEKITQIKYIDNTLIKKFKKEYENFKKIILDENIQVKLTNDIETINSQMDTKVNKSDVETINSQMDTKANKSDVETIKTQLDTIENNYEFNVLSPPRVIFEGRVLEPLKIDIEEDQKEKYIRLCKYAKSLRSGESGITLYFPKGIYYFSSIPLYDSINIRGDGKRATYFKPLESNEEYFIYLADGVVQKTFYSDFMCYGIGNVNKNINQGCISILSEFKNGLNSGGMWYTTFRNIEIKHFSTYCLNFNNSAVSTNLKNQFITFEDCEFFRLPNSDNSRCLQGQGNQFSFKKCEFSSPSPSDNGTNIEITGNHMTFDTCTIQNADYGFIGGGYITFINPWFENIGYSITDTTKTTLQYINFNIIGGNFANAGRMSDGTGYIAKNNKSNCFMTFTGSNIIGKVDTLYIELSNTTGGITFNKCTGINGMSRTSKNFTQVSSLTDIKVNLRYKPVILLNNGGEISKIQENYQSGEIVTIVCNGSATIKTGGNIQISKDIILENGDTVTIRRSDVKKTWIVVSVFKQSLLS